jgi:predicted nucleotidyltransferase
MTNTSLDLSNKLPVEQVNIIRHVVRAAESHQLRLFIVGAQARDLLLQYVYDLPVHRATNDIDFGIIVESWDEFTKLRDNLIVDKKFQPHRTMNQRLIHESDLLIDLVPFGNLEQVRGQISWPPDFSIVMSTAGFAEAYDNSVEIRIADDLIVKVASLAGLALMKIVAWDERRFERDVEDLALVMRHYLDAGNQNRIYTEEGDCFDLLNEEFDYDKASARILGRDIGRLVTDISRSILERVLSQELDQGSLETLVTVMIRKSASYYGNYDMALSMLTELRTGMSESDRF